MPAIVFPTSTAPSINPTENGGRLINCYSEPAPEGSRSKVIYRRAPGCDLAFNAGASTPRGALLVGVVLYIVNGDKCYSVTKAGSVYTVTPLGGNVGGSGPVFMAHNMRQPANQILIQHSSGIDKIASGSVSSFSDGDLPTTNSLCFQDGYFFHTTSIGQCFASDLNDTDVNSDSYITAEAQADGLVRGIPYRRELMLFGTSSTEFWQNAGNATGFPYSRGVVLNVGLWGPYAVAGHEPDFPGTLIWVANDYTIRRLNGYTPEVISTPQIQRLIEAVTDRNKLRASVHAAAGHLFWVLKSDDWTLVYDLSTSSWFERSTINQATWRMAFGIYAFNEWLVFDEEGTSVYRINERSRREAGKPLVMELRSAQQHNFPARTEVDGVYFDFVTGVGIDRGIYPIETNPKVSISWSDDGGVTFGNALLRELGTQGEILRAQINRCGTTKEYGRQWKIQISDPVEAALLGGSMFGHGNPP